MCIFCKISKKEISADFVYENGDYFAIKDIHPKAPTHILIIPKKHIESINAASEIEKGLLGGMIILAKEIAKKLEIDNSGYKLIFNVGRGGGQSVDHLHLHLLGGWSDADQLG